MEEVKENVLEKEIINVEASLFDDGYGNIKVKITVEGNNESFNIQIKEL